MTTTPDLECLVHSDGTHPAEEFERAGDGRAVHLEPTPHFALSGYPAVKRGDDWVVDPVFAKTRRPRPIRF